MKYFLGVDGGQSGTTAVIGDEDGVCSAERAKPDPAITPAHRKAGPNWCRAVTASSVAGSVLKKPDSITRPSPCASEAACFGDERRTRR